MLVVEAAPTATIVVVEDEAAITAALAVRLRAEGFAVEIAADDYMTKPFSQREFVARVRALLRRAQRAAEPGVGVMRPLQSLGSLKLKLGIVIVAAVCITAVATIVAVRWLELPSIVGAATGVVLALACVQLLARGTTRPLREMAAVASAMARGEHGRQVTVTSNDEVGELAQAFNRMTAELAETDRLRRDLVANVSHELRSTSSSRSTRPPTCAPTAILSASTRSS